MKVVIREFGSGNPVLPKHVNWAANDSEGKMLFGVVEFITVHVQKDDWSHYVSADLHLSLTEKRYVTRGVEVGVSTEVMSLDHLPRDHPFQEVTGTLLRTVRVAEIAQLGALGGIFVMLNRGEPPVSLLQWMGPQPQFAGEAGEVVRSMGPTRSNLELLSLHYHAAQMANAPPAKAVESTFGLPSRTAAYWIAKAKGEGLLDPLNFEYFIPPESWQREYRKPYESRWPDG